MFRRSFAHGAKPVSTSVERRPRPHDYETSRLVSKFATPRTGHDSFSMESRPICNEPLCQKAAERPSDSVGSPVCGRLRGSSAIRYYNP